MPQMQCEWVSDVLRFVWNALVRIRTMLKEREGELWNTIQWMRYEDENHNKCVNYALQTDRESQGRFNGDVFTLWW